MNTNPPEKTPAEIFNEKIVKNQTFDCRQAAIYWGQGKDVQIYNGSLQWIDLGSHDITLFGEFTYRIKPTSQTRDMVRSDFDGIPVIWVMFDEGTERMVSMIDVAGFYLGHDIYRTFHQLSGAKWSTDRKTWNEFKKEIA